MMVIRNHDYQRNSKERTICKLNLNFLSICSCQVLDCARRRLAAVLQERSRVLDLVCSALPSTTSVSASTALYGSRAIGNGRLTRMSADSRLSGHTNSPIIEPLGPYTPEADQALQEAKDARSRSSMLRKELSDAISRVDKMQKAAHRSVNSGLTAKVAETVTLKVGHGAINEWKDFFLTYIGCNRW